MEAKKIREMSSVQEVIKVKKECKIITDSEQADAFKAKMTTGELRKTHDQLLKEAVMRQEDHGLKEVLTTDKGRGVVSTKMFQAGEFIVE